MTTDANNRVHVRADKIYTLCGQVIEADTLTLASAPSGAILCWTCRAKAKAQKLGQAPVRA